MIVSARHRHTLGARRQFAEISALISARPDCVPIDADALISLPIVSATDDRNSDGQQTVRWTVCRMFYVLHLYMQRRYARALAYIAFAEKNRSHAAEKTNASLVIAANRDAILFYSESYKVYDVVGLHIYEVYRYIAYIVCYVVDALWYDE